MYIKTELTLINTENGFFSVEGDELKFYTENKYIKYNTLPPEKLLNLITEKLLLGCILLDLTDIDLEDL